MSATELNETCNRQVDLIKIEREFEKRHLLICTLLSICAFLFIVCLCLLSALVWMGNTYHQQESHSSKKSADQYLHDNDNKNSILKSAKFLNDSADFGKLEVSYQEIYCNLSGIVSHENNSKIIQGTKMNANKVAAGVTSKVLSHLTFRLPREIKPLHYDLFLAPDLKTNAFNGNVKIKIKIEDSIPYIALHANKLNITSTDLLKVNPDNGSLQKVNILQTFPYEKYEYFVIEPEKLLMAGNYEIKMQFDGRLDKRIIGFYSSKYFDERKNETRYVVVE